MRVQLVHSLQRSVDILSGVHGFHQLGHLFVAMLGNQVIDNRAGLTIGDDDVAGFTDESPLVPQGVDPAGGDGPAKGACIRITGADVAEFSKSLIQP